MYQTAIQSLSTTHHSKLKRLLINFQELSFIRVIEMVVYHSHHEKCDILQSAGQKKRIIICYFVIKESVLWESNVRRWPL